MSASLRPTATDDWELCIVDDAGNLTVHRITFNDILRLVEQMMRIVLAKFAGRR